MSRAVVTDLLVIAGEEIRRYVVELDANATFVDSLTEGARAVSAGEFDAVIADLRVLGTSIDEAYDTLWPDGLALPTLVVLDHGATERGLEARRRHIGWLTGEWLEVGGSELMQACFEGARDAFEKLETLQTYEERHEQLVHAEKFAAVGLLAAEIAHEINNPATFIITNLSVMKDYVKTLGVFHASVRQRLEEGPIDRDTFHELESEHEIRFLEEDLQPLLDRSLAGLNRIHQIVQDLRFFSRRRDTESRPVRVGGLIEASANLVRHEARYRTNVVLDLEYDPPMKTDANRLSQVILNVLLNAVQSIVPGAPDANEVRVTTYAREGMLAIEIRDTGTGIEPELQERIFEPFFTTREPGEGTGLGLSISHDIMAAIGGRIELSSTPGEGTVFTLLIPMNGAGDDEE